MVKHIIQNLEMRQPLAIKFDTIRNILVIGGNHYNEDIAMGFLLFVFNAKVGNYHRTIPRAYKFRYEVIGVSWEDYIYGLRKISDLFFTITKVKNHGKIMR